MGGETRPISESTKTKATVTNNGVTLNMAFREPGQRQQNTHLHSQVGHLADVDGHGQRRAVERLGEAHGRAEEGVARELDPDDAGEDGADVNADAQLHLAQRGRVGHAADHLEHLTGAVEHAAHLARGAEAEVPPEVADRRHVGVVNDINLEGKGCRQARKKQAVGFKTMEPSLISSSPSCHSQCGGPPLCR